jgi:hypothetical protein
VTPVWAGDEITTIEITSKPLVKDVLRLGISIGRAGGYSGSTGILRKAARLSEAMFH